MFAEMLKQAFPDVVGRPEATQLLKFLDYSEYGGAPLLGIQGVSHHLPRRITRPGDHERGARGHADGADPRQSGHRRRVCRRWRGRVKRPIAQLMGTGSYAPARVVPNAELSTFSIPPTSGSGTARVSANAVWPDPMSRTPAWPRPPPSGRCRPAESRRSISTRSWSRPAPPIGCSRLRPAISRRCSAPRNAAAFDVSAACSGFMYGLNVAEGLVASEQARTVLVVAAEKLTSIVDWTDRTTAVLFGDGAGAAIMRPSTNGRGILSTYHEVRRDAGGSALPSSRRSGASARRADAQGPLPLRPDGGTRSLQSRCADHGRRL